MKTYRQLCDGKMWKAVDFMIKGLEAVESIPHRETMMSTFGNYNLTEDICYGCMATAACEAASGVTYDKDSIRVLSSRAVASLNPKVGESLIEAFQDQDKFECAIDELRLADPELLLEYFYPDVDMPDNIGYSLPLLESDAWPKYIHRYAEFRDFLKELDL